MHSWKSNLRLTQAALSEWATWAKYKYKYLKEDVFDYCKLINVVK